MVLTCINCFLENACENCPFTMDHSMGKVRHEQEKEEGESRQKEVEYRQSIEFGTHAIPV